MSSLVTNITVAVGVLYLAASFVFFHRTRNRRAFALSLLGLVLLFVLLRVSTGFPSSRQAFGGAAQSMVILTMFGCVVIGMAANHLFYLRDRFSLLDFVRPILVSPLVMLPLIGSLPATGSVERVVFISLAFLAFQNGFFWKSVFDREVPNATD